MESSFSVDTLIIIFQLCFDTIMLINAIRPARNEYTNLTPFATNVDDNGESLMASSGDDGHVDVVTQQPSVMQPPVAAHSVPLCVDRPGLFYLVM
jgi:hypothetical protein